MLHDSVSFLRWAVFLTVRHGVTRMAGIFQLTPRKCAVNRYSLNRRLRCSGCVSVAWSKSKTTEYRTCNTIASPEYQIAKIMFWMQCYHTPCQLVGSTSLQRWHRICYSDDNEGSRACLIPKLGWLSILARAWMSDLGVKMEELMLPSLIDICFDYWDGRVLAGNIALFFLQKSKAGRFCGAGEWPLVLPFPVFPSHAPPNPCEPHL